jgi:hypothetical protein
VGIDDPMIGGFEGISDEDESDSNESTQIRDNPRRNVGKRPHAGEPETQMKRVRTSLSFPERDGTADSSTIDEIGALSLRGDETLTKPTTLNSTLVDNLTQLTIA